ncbi:MAG: hypothetical protein JXR88_10725 [Clostridia bacterium]|nr:hypothetical protein [Clostridia bacterium]
MKLKLKIQKKLKRDLKLQAETQELDRAEYVAKSICAYLDTKTLLSDQEIMSLIQDQKEKEEALASYLITVEKNDALDEKEKTNLINQYKYEHLIFENQYSKNKKSENLIIELTEVYYYTCLSMAIQRKMGLENFVEQMIYHYK